MSVGLWSRAGGLAFGILSSTILMAGDAFAANIGFHSSLGASAEHIGNREGVGETARSEDVFRLNLSLALTVDTRSTGLRLSYSPYREIHEDRSERNNTGHFFGATLGHRASRKTTVGVAVRASRTNRQRLRFEFLEIPDSLAPRTKVDDISLFVSGSTRSGARSSFSWGVGGAITAYDNREDFGFEDSTAATASFSWAYDTSPKTKIGVTYVFDDFTFDSDVLDTSAQTLGVTVGVRLGRQLTLDLVAGMRGIEQGDLADNRPTVSVALRRGRTTRGSSFSVVVEDEVSRGDGTSGTSKDRGGYLTWNYATRADLSFGVRSAYWRREDTADFGVEILSVRDGVTWSPARRFSVSVYHYYVVQDPLKDTARGFTGDFHSFGATLGYTISGPQSRRVPGV